jgi:GNAT superfamily N-acetyltransferase
MTFRRATLNDCALLAELNHQLIRDEGHRNKMSVPELEERMKGWLASEYAAVIFEDRKEIVAYALYREQPEEIYLRHLFVVRDRRRQGIGIAAPAETIYRALTTEEGIRPWWTTDVKIDASAGGSATDWVGTTQEFILEPQADGEVLLKFCHGGWERGGDHCYHCNTTWGHLLVCLKDYAERG